MPVAQRVLPDAWLYLSIPRAHLLALHLTETDTPLGRCKVKLPLAYAVAQAWGFDAYSTCFIWTKTDEECPEDHGLGLIVSGIRTKCCACSSAGADCRSLTPMRKSDRTIASAPARIQPSPPYYRDMINAMTGHLPVLELFAREDEEHQLPDNFYTWGNQSKTPPNYPRSIPMPTTPTRTPKPKPAIPLSIFRTSCASGIRRAHGGRRSHETIANTRRTTCR